MSHHNVSRQALGRSQLYKNFLIVSLFLFPTFHYALFFFKKRVKLLTLWQPLGQNTFKFKADVLYLEITVPRISRTLKIPCSVMLLQKAKVSGKNFASSDFAQMN